MGTMRSHCDEAETQLRLTNEASKSLLERAGSLRRERSVPIIPLEKNCSSIIPGKKLRHESLLLRCSLHGSL